MALIRGAVLPLALAAVCLLLALSGDSGREWLRYERSALPAQPWRLLTAHLVHLGWSHLLLNLGGLALVWALVGEHLGVRQWALVAAVSGFAVSGGLWLLDPGLAWYVGLSGVLHGLLVAGAVAGPGRRTGEMTTLLILVGAKLAWEQYSGPLPGSEFSAGGPVVVDAHLFGTVGGLVAGINSRFIFRSPDGYREAP